MYLDTYARRVPAEVVTARYHEIKRSKAFIGHQATEDTPKQSGLAMYSMIDFYDALAKHLTEEYKLGCKSEHNLVVAYSLPPA